MTLSSSSFGKLNNYRIPQPSRIKSEHEISEVSLPVFHQTKAIEKIITERKHEIFLPRLHENEL